MKWQQRIRVTTGLSCWQIMLHLAVIGALLVGWKTASLIPVGVGLCLLYTFTVILMFVFQRFRSGSTLRDVGDFLEELTTTWYFGTAMIALWLLSRVVQSPVLLTIAGLAMIAGPAIYSLVHKEKSGNFSPKQPVRR